MSDMSDKITQPPLGREFWEGVTKMAEPLMVGWVLPGRNEMAIVEPPQCFALAALALYRQPFGFTHQDVLELRAVGEFARAEAGNGLTEADARALLSIADRIAALLPPPEATP
jgi:hypothetical protein